MLVVPVAPTVRIIPCAKVAPRQTDVMLPTSASGASAPDETGLIGDTETAASVDM